MNCVSDASYSVAVCSRSFSQNAILRSELLERFPRAKFNDSGRTLMGDDLVSFLAGHTRAIVGLETLSREVLRQLPQLRVVSKYGVGLDMIDQAAMADFGIQLRCVPGVNRRAVAELALALTLIGLRRIGEANVELRRGRWQQVQGRQLTNKTVGVIGCGNIGKELVKLLVPFDCTVIVNDIRTYPEFFEAYRIESVSLDNLLHRADVISIHVPLDSTTRGLISKERLARVKAGAVLVNTARGGIVDEEAASEFLSNGLLSATAFDVFAEEPTVPEGLLLPGNSLATPHMGGSAVEAVLAMGRAAIAQLMDASC